MNFDFEILRNDCNKRQERQFFYKCGLVSLLNRFNFKVECLFSLLLPLPQNSTVYGYTPCFVNILLQMEPNFMIS